MYKLKFKIISVFVLITFFFSSSLAPVLAAVTYNYDSNGNMMSDGTKCYEYNQANQLKKVKTCSNSQTIAEYVYDYNGNRIIKKEYQGGSLKRTIYSPDDEFQTVKQASNGATQNTTFYQANGEIVAQKNPDGTKTYLHNDHLGSSSVVSNQAGGLVEKTAYEPYGEVKSGGTLAKFQYTGQEKDQETGLNYYGARYYDPHLQRFTQPDDIIQNPYNPQSLNRYSYVNNNPIRYTDPTGHFIWIPVLIAAGGFALGAATGVATFSLEHPNATLEQKIAAGLAGGVIGAGGAIIGMYASAGLALGATIAVGSAAIDKISTNLIAGERWDDRLIEESIRGGFINIGGIKGSNVLKIARSTVGRPVEKFIDRTLTSSFSTNGQRYMAAQLSSNVIASNLNIQKAAITRIDANNTAKAGYVSPSKKSSNFLIPDKNSCLCSRIVQ